MKRPAPRGRRAAVRSPKVPRRFRAVGEVDPRRLPPGAPYACDDPYVGTRVAGDDFAGTVVGCATPPAGKRGRYFTVGTVTSGGAIGRAKKRSAARREALRERYEGPDFDARPKRRAKTSGAKAPPSRAPLALPAPAEDIVHRGEVVDVARLPRGAWIDPRTAPTWGGARVAGARDLAVDRYHLPRDPRRPSALPRLDEIAVQEPARGMRALAPQGARLGRTHVADGPGAAPVVVAPAALDALLRAYTRGWFIASEITSSLASAVTAALLDVLRTEGATPGTHFPLEIAYRYHRTVHGRTSTAFPYGRPVSLMAMVNDAPVALVARAVRFADGREGVLVDRPRAAEGSLPAWFPGMPAQVLPDREPTPAQRKILAGAKVTTFPFVPLRADVHPDGRLRIIHVALDAPRDYFTSTDKPPAPGTERGSTWTPLGTRATFDNSPDPLWRPVADLRIAPTPDAAAMPTFAQTADEAVDARGYKARARVVAALEAHWIDVANALRTGRPVAPEVVAAYPALATFYAASARTGRSRAEVLAEEAAAQRAMDHADDPDVTVHWSVKEGLLLYTRGKESKIISAIKSLRSARFKWSRNLGAWFKPQSVGVSESTTNIDGVARELRAAGLVVRVERGASGVALGEANERRQEHKFWRAEGYAERAGNALVEGADLDARADAIRADIPVGAPTRRAERTEARADRTEAKAEAEYEYAQRAAGTAENLARTAAGYDVTATITRKEAERRADAFARLFVPKAKGLTGAKRLASDKIDNLSEYRVSWGVEYPPSAGRAALVSYDGRSVLVVDIPRAEVDWSPHAVGRAAKIILADPNARGVVLRADVTQLDAEAVFEKVIAALPKVSLAGLGDRSPSDPVAYQVELSEYGRTRIPEAVFSAFAPARGWSVVFRRAYLERGFVARPMRFGEEAADGSESGKSVELRHVEGLRFRVTGRRPDEGQERVPAYMRRTHVVGETDVDLAGVSIAQAWANFVEVTVAMMSGGAIAATDIATADDQGARRPASPERWPNALSAYGSRRVAVLGKAFPLARGTDRWTLRVERPERFLAPTNPLVSYGDRKTLPIPVLLFQVYRGKGEYAIPVHRDYPTIEVDIRPERASIRRVDVVTQDLINHTRGPVSVEGPAVPIVLDGLTVAQGWDLIIAHAEALLSGRPFVPPRAPRAPKPPKTGALTGREDPRITAMRGPAVREGSGLVETLPRDAADAAAASRVGEVRARTRRVAASAAERLADRRGASDAREAELLAAARAHGNSLGFYPTPPTLAEYVADLAELRPGARVLEPSAGMGGLIAPLVARGARVTAIEYQPDRAAYLAAAWAAQGVDVATGDFLSVAPAGDYDAVVMNPPFSIEGRRYTDAEHVLHALAFLRPGGRLVAIVSPETPRGTGARRDALRAALRGWPARWEAVDPGRFRISGTDIPVAILVATRPA